ncbi:MAG TPA: nickel pincer cofactor biosynthesis protein LarB [Actinomycetota bacterium]|jgi:NCAIR mutase (PurE)-related protein|nr:nickel pincer cofactor biosynthesis protein LarB [Actinomycetota bacterium]
MSDDSLPFANLDHEREDRWGLPEAVLGIGKTPEQVAEIVLRLKERNRGPILVTKTNVEAYEAVRAVLPEAEFHEAAGLMRIWRDPVVAAGTVGVLAAGTADIPIAEEAALTAEAAGAAADRIYDVGVAGLHRLVSKLERITTCDALVVVAGMEGALPTVVGGLTGLPIVAVPTSIGYGTSLNGVAALLGMLNSCAPQVVAVNIDNGFGAGFFAALVTRKR